MQNRGSFTSEAFKDGRRYVFEAHYDDFRWQARIRDESGHLHGEIECARCDGEVCGEELEDAVSDWVHNAIAHEVGFHATETCVERPTEGRPAAAVDGPVA